MTHQFVPKIKNVQAHVCWIQPKNANKSEGKFECHPCPFLAAVTTDQSSCRTISSSLARSRYASLENDSSRVSLSLSHDRRSKMSQCLTRSGSIVLVRGTLPALLAATLPLLTSGPLVCSRTVPEERRRATLASWYTFGANTVLWSVVADLWNGASPVKM